MATPNISPWEVAIMALHLSKTHSDGPALDKELTSALNEKGLSDKSIADLIKEAVPIFKLVCTSLDFTSTYRRRNNAKSTSSTTIPVP